MKEIEMAAKKTTHTPPPTGTKTPGASELNNPDFQFVLKAFLAAYEPILEQQLKLANDPAKLEKEAESSSSNLNNDMAQANEIFAKFLTDDVARRMLPSEVREKL